MDEVCKSCVRLHETIAEVRETLRQFREAASVPGWVAFMESAPNGFGLSPGAASVLAMLVKRGQCSYEQLAQAALTVRSAGVPASRDHIQVLIAQARKVGVQITTLRGAGYRLEPLMRNLLQRFVDGELSAETIGVSGFKRLRDELTPWTPEEISLVRAGWLRGDPVKVIGGKVPFRTAAAIRQLAHRSGFGPHPAGRNAQASM